jgi:hypothetical protein
LLTVSAFRRQGRRNRTGPFCVRTRCFSLGRYESAITVPSRTSNPPIMSSSGTRLRGPSGLLKSMMYTQPFPCRAAASCNAIRSITASRSGNFTPICSQFAITVHNSHKQPFDSEKVCSQVFFLELTGKPANQLIRGLSPGMAIAGQLSTWPFSEWPTIRSGHWSLLRALGR